jgi:hypothetical protein
MGWSARKRRGRGPAADGNWWTADAEAYWLLQTDFSDLAGNWPLTGLGGIAIDGTPPAVNKLQWPTQEQGRYFDIGGVPINQLADFAIMSWTWYEWYNQPMFILGHRDAANNGFFATAVDNGFRIRLTIGGVLDGYSGYATPAYPSWVHWGLSWSAATRVASVTVNGAPVTGISGYSSLGSAAAANLYLCSRNYNGTPDNTMRGRQGTVALYKRQVAAAEFAEVYNATKSYY